MINWQSIKIQKISTQSDTQVCKWLYFVPIGICTIKFSQAHLSLTLKYIINGPSIGKNYIVVYPAVHQTVNQIWLNRSIFVGEVQDLKRGIFYFYIHFPILESCSFSLLFQTQINLYCQMNHLLIHASQFYYLNYTVFIQFSLLIKVLM